MGLIDEFSEADSGTVGSVKKLVLQGSRNVTEDVVSFERDKAIIKLNMENMGPKKGFSVLCGYVAMSCNVMFTSHEIDGWNPTHKNGDEWGMVYGIAVPTSVPKKP